jgi:hypothetical protein
MTFKEWWEGHEDFVGDMNSAEEAWDAAMVEAERRKVKVLEGLHKSLLEDDDYEVCDRTLDMIMDAIRVSNNKVHDRISGYVCD